MKVKATKALGVFTVATMSLLCLSAQEVQVRTYSAAGSGSPTGNRVESRLIVPPDSPAFVGEQPFAFAVMPMLEAPDRSMDSVLFRFNLFVGAHRCTYIFDLGLIGGITDYEMNGLAISGIFNRIGTSGGAFQFAGICNCSSLDMNGCQLAAAWNWTGGRFAGLQLGLMNRGGSLDGLQLGGLNLAEQGSGVQIGVVNVSERLEGLQIGALNVNRDSAVPVMPVLNFAF
ncbi:MAG: LA_2272 family surface repeat-containing protein [Kiritimatiellia bacterium]